MIGVAVCAGIWVGNTHTHTHTQLYRIAMVWTSDVRRRHYRRSLKNKNDYCSVIKHLIIELMHKAPIYIPVETDGRRRTSA